MDRQSGTVSIPVIITAAGRSTRHPPNKLLLELDGIPVIARTVAAFAGLVGSIILVTGHESGKTVMAVDKHYSGMCTIVFNPEYRQGLATSIRAGLQTVNSSAPIVGFCNGDRPFIKRETVAAVLRECVQHPTDICFPRYAHQPGQPIFFPGDLLPELRELSGEEGGRVVRDRYGERQRPVPVEDRGVILDMDRFLETGI